ncbi:MAG: hypothetical protein ACXVXJ_05030 [Mycobacteriaceae bacterium]
MRSSWPSVALSSVALLAVTPLLSGCSSEDRAAVAAAKCSLPVDQKAGFISQPVDAGDRYGGLPEKRAVEVTDLGDGRYEVTGQTVLQTDKGIRGADFDCVVSPDKRDKLRGFAVTRLRVGPVRNLG